MTVAFIVLIITIATIMSIAVIMAFGTVVVVMVMVVSFPARFIINWGIRFPVDASIVRIGGNITSTKYVYSS
jgi:hypothetical protein